MVASNVSTEHMSKCDKCTYYCRTGATFLFSHIGLCGLVFGYTVLGAFTFEFLEAPHEIAMRQEVINDTMKVVRVLWDFTERNEFLSEGNWTDNATKILARFEERLVTAVKKNGFDGTTDLTATPQWSFSGSLLFSIIVITTIGYGNIAPKTDAGKIVTILYAIVGLPLLMLCLSNIGDAMAHSFKFMYWKVCCYLCTSPKPHRKSKINRSIDYEGRSGTLQSTTSAPYDSTAVRRNVYGGTASATQYDRNQTYLSLEPNQSSLTRGHSSYNPREVYASDANKVPVITNRYILNLADSQVNQIHRYMTGSSNTYPQSSANLMRNPPSRIQDTMTAPFLPIIDDTDMDDTISVESDRSDEEDHPEQANVPMALCISIVVGYICGGAILFSYWEGWDYSDSCYFCFITLTTIGFGDMVPGSAVISEDSQVTLGLCSLYLLFGMALLAMSFNLVQEEVTKSVTTIGKRIGILSDEDEDADDM